MIVETATTQHPGKERIQSMRTFVGVANMESATILLLFVLLVLFACILRFFYLASQVGNIPKSLKRSRSDPCKTLIVVGAGGHAMEMMRLVSGVDQELYRPRVYVVASNDSLSEGKIQELERTAFKRVDDSSSGVPSEYEIRRIIRARNIRQSYLSSVCTTAASLLNTLPIIASVRPSLVLCNGPGTCIPVCLCAYLLKFLCLSSVKIVYVESNCRVQRLSLSALILYHLFIADQLLVQWPSLAQAYPRTKYIGRLV